MEKNIPSLSNFLPAVIQKGVNREQTNMLGEYKKKCCWENVSMINGNYAKNICEKLAIVNCSHHNAIRITNIQDLIAQQMLLFIHNSNPFTI